MLIQCNHGNQGFDIIIMLLLIVNIQPKIIPKAELSGRMQAVLKIINRCQNTSAVENLDKIL